MTERLWMMLVDGMVAYTVYAASKEEARQKIEEELSPRDGRRIALLERWIAAGRPVCASKPRYAR